MLCLCLVQHMLHQTKTKQFYTTPLTVFSPSDNSKIQGFLGGGGGGSAVAQCLTRDRKAVGSSHTGVTALYPLARTFILA